MNVKGKNIVITGAASGIGRALAIECARQGASVATGDVDMEGAAETRDLAEAARSGDTKCSAHELDVGSLQAWQAFREEVISEHGAVDGIINNAGVTFSGTVEDTPYSQIERVMSVNFMGMVYGSKEFLDDLKDRPESCIANVSSIFGLFPMKNQSAYCSSKFAIRGFTGVLAQELKSTNVTVSSIHPGHIGTEILQHALEEGNVAGTELTEKEQAEVGRAFKALGLSPERAANIILDGIRKKKPKIVVGKDALRGDILSRLYPKTFVNIMNRLAP